MYDFSGKSDYDFTTVSFRCYVKHAKLISQAATKADQSVADYVRSLSLQWAASDLGVPAPAVSTPGQIEDAIQRAAKQRGLSKQEYYQQLALADIAAKSPESAPATVPRESYISGLRPKVKTG